MNKVSKIFSPFYLLNLSAAIALQVVALVLVYILSPEDYGYYALITSVAQIMYILCSGWNNATVVNLGTKYYKETGSYKNVIIYRLYLVSICFLFISIVFILAKDSIIRFTGSFSNYLLAYIFFLGLVLNDFVSQILYPGDKNKLQAGIMFFNNIIILSFVLLFVHTVKDYIYFNTAMQLLVCITLCSLFVHFFGKTKYRFNKNDFKFFLTYSSWQLFGVIGVYLINLGTNYVLRYYKIPVEEIGLYNFAYKLFCGFVPIFALAGVVIPKWIHDKNINNKRMYVAKRLIFIYLVTMGLYLILYLILPYFLVLINKEDYNESVQMYLMLFPGFLFFSFNQLMNPVVLNSPYYRHSQYSALLHGAGLILVSFILVGRYGMQGALWANVISFAISTIYLIILYFTRIKYFLEAKL